MTESSRRHDLDFALELARIAEAEILPYYRRCTVKLKPDGSEVTEADRAAEEAIRRRIEREFPADSILGEEFGTSGDAASPRQWVIDPLDGTASFTLGLPGFGTLIALCEGGEPTVGVIHFPVLGETYYAGTGLGCWWSADRTEASPMRLAVVPVASLAEAVGSATGTHATDIQPHPDHPPYALTRLIRAVRKFRFVSDCQQHALVCRGRLQTAVDTIMSPWDIAAIVPCVEEAGGVATDIRGERAGLIHRGSLVTSSDAAIHREVLELLRPDA